MERMPLALLPLAPEEGARRLALLYLDQAAGARPRLGEAGDAEALHDFRVALRRLRGCLQAYDAQLEDGISRRLARRLRRLARATGPGRDAEVQMAWLRERGGVLTRYQRPGLLWLLGRLADRLAAAKVELCAEVAHDFGRLDEEMRERLSVYRAEVHLDEVPRPTFGGVTAKVLRGAVKDLAERLGRVEGPAQARQAHRARIRGKRLRYLLDPLAPELEERSGVGRLVKRLKALQELLGELHDAQVLEQELGEALGAAAAARAGRLFDLALAPGVDSGALRAERRRPYDAGILALARLNRERRDGLFAELAEEWLGGMGEAFLAELEEVAAVLEEVGRGQAS